MTTSAVAVTAQTMMEFARGMERHAAKGGTGMSVAIRDTIAAILLTLAAPAVVDGDTVRVVETRIRLVGYDAPELHARCPAERIIAEAARATLTANAERLRFTLVDCTGTNYGRLCAVATFRDNGYAFSDYMIAKGLARSYRCTATRCPSREPWC